MAVLRDKSGDNLMVDCFCGCDEGLRIRVNKGDDDSFFLMTYTNGNFYRDQNENFISVIGKKLKKIWAIITNKDYCYSEICMSRDDLNEFKEFINSIE